MDIEAAARRRALPSPLLSPSFRLFGVALAVAALVAACSPGPASRTPGADATSSSPGGAGSPAESRASSAPAATASPPAGTGTPPTATGSPPSGHPRPTATGDTGGGDGDATGSTEIVLRMEHGGGFVPMGFRATELPQFTLYRDGTVIHQGAAGGPAPGPDAPLPPLRVARMDQEQMDALVRFALGPGRLLDAKPLYEDFMVADAPTTVFTIDAAGVTKRVSVYALGIGDDQSPDRADLAGFARLAALLADFGMQVGQGNATDAGVYEPERYRAVLTDAPPAEADPVAWPWEDVSPSDFRDTDGLRSTVVTRSQAEQLVARPAGGHMGVTVEAPDGKRYSVALRPLLPDEDR